MVMKASSCLGEICSYARGRTTYQQMQHSMKHHTMETLSRFTALGTQTQTIEVFESWVCKHGFGLCPTVCRDVQTCQEYKSLWHSVTHATATIEILINHRRPHINNTNDDDVDGVDNDDDDDDDTDINNWRTEYSCLILLISNSADFQFRQIAKLFCLITWAGDELQSSRYDNGKPRQVRTV
jgi:hypothetical protein